MGESQTAYRNCCDMIWKAATWKTEDIVLEQILGKYVGRRMRECV
jgi:hypothetical protein